MMKSPKLLIKLKSFQFFVYSNGHKFKKFYLDDEKTQKKLTNIYSYLYWPKL